MRIKELEEFGRRMTRKRVSDAGRRGRGEHMKEKRPERSTGTKAVD